MFGTFGFSHYVLIIFHQNIIIGLLVRFWLNILILLIYSVTAMMVGVVNFVRSQIWMNASIDPAPSLLIAQILLDPFTAPADLATPEMDWTADRIWNLWWQLMCLTTTARLTWAGVASAPTMVLSIWRSVIEFHLNLIFIILNMNMEKKKYAAIK